jgi:hypothetical protein
MLSIRDQLKLLANYTDGFNHLPPGFDATKGLRTLFPPNKAASLSALKNYVLTFSGSQQTPGGVAATYQITADGVGRWGFLFSVTNGQSSGLFGGGFVFAFSDDGFGHGWVLTANAVTEDGPPWEAAAQGTDQWIRDNWPQIFVQTVDTYLSDAEGFATLPPMKNAATDYGFKGLTLLQGANLPVSQSEFAQGIDEGRPGDPDDEPPGTGHI